MQFSRYIVICTWIVASLRRQHLRAMNIHGIRTHPPGLYIVISVPDVLPLSHVLLSIFKTLSQVLLFFWTGSHLLSRAVSSKVPSAA